ncbi:MAG: WG repeat-containing protein [Muribaculaceae bacterium]
MKISYVLGLVALLFATCACSKSADEIIDIDYVAVKMDGDHWSLMDKDGNIVCKDEFSKRPTAAIEGMFFVEEGNGYAMYKAGEKPEAIEDCQDLRDYGFFNDGLCLVTFPGERISIVNTKGKKVATLGPINGHEITWCNASFGDGLILARLDDDTYGYLNRKGEKAIDFKYSEATPFNEGLAVVKKDDQIMVINTSGETVFKIKEGIRIISNMFTHGYIWGRYESDDRCVVIDRDGNVTKCPTKVHGISSFDGTYFIFYNEDYDDGLLALKDMEIVIRAKYKNLSFLPDGNLLAHKDDYYLILNKDDEEQHRISDYEEVGIIVPGFGLFAEDHKIITRIDYDGKALDKNEFTAIAAKIPGSVESDYFDYAGMASKVVSLINDNGVDKYKLGSNPSKFFSNASSYTYTRYVSIDSLGSGYCYQIEGQLMFDEYMADYHYNYDWWTGRTNSYYSWRSTCQLFSVYLNVISSERKISDRGAIQVTNLLVDKGFKIEKKTEEGVDEYCAVLSRKNILVMVNAKKNTNGFVVAVVKNEDSIRSGLIDEVVRLNSGGNSSDRVEEAVCEECCDSVAVW